MHYVHVQVHAKLDRYKEMDFLPPMKGSECLGVESALTLECIQQNVGGAGREGCTGGQAVAGRETNECAGAQREQRWDSGEMTDSYREEKAENIISNNTSTQIAFSLTQGGTHIYTKQAVKIVQNELSHKRRQLSTHTRTSVS